MTEPASSGSPAVLEDRDYQRTYYSRPAEKPRMAPVRSRYVERHLQQVLATVAPAPGARILEVGCGMGRFSLLLAERGFRVSGIDLSPDLLTVLRQHDPEGRITTVCGDATEAERHLQGPFDAVVGFFVLHHLRSYEKLFRTLAALLASGGQLAFCEPNAWNALFYLQILLTPSMSFRGDGGVARMRRSVIGPAVEQSGLRGFAISRYGLFPPRLANHPRGAALEGRLERLRILQPWLAFQILSARRAD